MKLKSEEAARRIALVLIRSNLCVDDLYIVAGMFTECEIYNKERGFILSANVAHDISAVIYDHCKHL
jgi:hypothetical protein